MGRRRKKGSGTLSYLSTSLFYFFPPDCVTCVLNPGPEDRSRNRQKTRVCGMIVYPMLGGIFPFPNHGKKTNSANLERRAVFTFNSVPMFPFFSSSPHQGMKELAKANPKLQLFSSSHSLSISLSALQSLPTPISSLLFCFAPSPYPT